MCLNEEHSDFLNYDLETKSAGTNRISILDVFEYIAETNQEDVLRIVKFCEQFSGITSIKKAAKSAGVSEASYSVNKKHQKIKFCGKTFGVKKTK